MRRWGIYTVFICILLMSGTSAGFAAAGSEDGRNNIEWNGALRLNGGYNFNGPAEVGIEEGGMNSSEVRIICQGTFAEKFDFELHLTGAVASKLPYLNGAFASSVNTTSTYRNSHLTFYDNSDGSVSGGTGLDRVMLRFNGDRLSLSIGRFPINWSVASFGTVNDFFAPFSASAINTEYKPGVDAVDVSVQVGNMSTLEVAAVLGNKDVLRGNGMPSVRDSALLVHARTLVKNVELAVLGGRLARKWVAGTQVQGELGPFSLYEDAHVGFPDQDEPRDVYVKSATGFNVMFNFRNATLGGEYLFSSEGTSPDNYMTFYRNFPSPDELMYAGRHYGFVHTGIELHPLVQAGGAFLMNLEDLSGLVTLSASFSLGDNAECVAGALFPFGDSLQYDNSGQMQLESEFGNSPSSVFVELRYYI